MDAHSLLHRMLSGAAHVVRRPERIILALHETPSAAALHALLDTLAAMGFRFRSVEEIADGAPGCALTFDDGDRSIIDIVAPVLADRGVPASAYVVAGLIGSDRPFWWVEVEGRAGEDAPRLIREMKRMPDSDRLELLEQLRSQSPDVEVRQRNLEPEELLELEAAGITVGNHSLSHPLLDRCPDEKVALELREAHERLTSLLGREPTQIAYPNGNEDHRVIDIARKLGYRIGLLFDHRPLDRLGDPLRLSRIRLDVGAPRAVVRSHASGVHSRVHALRGGS